MRMLREFWELVTGEASRDLQVRNEAEHEALHREIDETRRGLEDLAKAIRRDNVRRDH